MAFDGSFVSDGFARFSKVMILFGAAATLALSHDYLVKAGLMKFEYPVLIVLSVVGMMTMVSARDLIVLYMGLELQSLALYVVAAFRRDSLRSTEAGLKYFVLGALSSGLLLYGASLTYGFAGTTGFAGIAESIGRGAAGAGAGLRAGVPLRRHRLQGVGGAVPHVDARRLRGLADAGDGLLRHGAEGGGGGDVRAAACSTPSGARWGTGSRSWRSCRWPRCSSARSAAIGQRNFKRLMAYSSISHMGYALMGLAAGTEQGAQSLLIYLAIYVAMNVGVFAFILNMERDGKPVTDIVCARALQPGGAGAGAGAGGADVQPGGGAAAGRLLREVLRAEGGGGRRAGLAGGGGRGGERDRRLSTTCASSI